MFTTFSNGAPIPWVVVSQQDTPPDMVSLTIGIILGGLALLGVALAVIARRDESLRTSQALLSAVIETALDGVLTIDHKGIIQSCNPAAEQLFGYGRGYLVGQPIHILMPSPYRDEHAGYITRYLTTGEARIIGKERELTGQKKDGTPFPLMLAVTEFRVGQERFFTGIVRDITARKQVESVEREERELAEVMRDTASALYSTLDLNVVVDNILSLVERIVPHDEANVVLVDSAGAAWTLVARTGLQGEVAPLKRSSITPAMERALMHDNVLLVSNTNTDPRWHSVKEARHCESYLGVTLRHAGRAIGFISLDSQTPGFFTPIHANRLIIFANQAASALENARLYDELEAYNTRIIRTVEERTAELRNAKDRVETVLNNSPDATLLLDPSGSIQTGNRAFIELFGYPIDEVFGHSPDMLMVRTKTADWKRLMRKVVRGSEQVRAEVVALHKDGTRFEVELAIAPIQGDGNLEGFVCSLRDIRALKHVERMKDAFVSNVSHELRTPVTSFKLFLRLLQRVPQEDHGAIIATLVRETERLNNIINDVLNLSRLDQGSVELVRTEASLNMIIETFISDRVMLARERGIWLSFELAPGLPPALVDTGLAGQAVNVLLTNALNYTPANGKVIVQTSQRQLDRRQWLVCSIADTGPGVTPDDQTFLFERFYRGQAGRESSQPGTGLGLSIAKEIMDRHGGKITVESTGVPGEGADFSLWFPIRRARLPAAANHKPDDAKRPARH